ncbi:MAG: glutamyl-tRNA reductase [Opitutae bacterium]|nr:glutamyl-tRNA reductase [Opitutae bacterium]
MPAEEPNLFLLGSSHRVASLEEREKISLPADSIDDFYKGLQELPGLKESLVLNTCNRTEIYVSGNGSPPLDPVREYLMNFRGLDNAFLEKHTYRRQGEAVVKHALEVTSGIDSQMVGETEILGQVKDAYDDALNRESTGKVLNRVFQKSFQAAKWARTHTGISRGQVNLGNVICELARRIYGEMKDCRFLAVGSGEVAEMTVEAFSSRGSQAITITGRTFDWCPLSRNKPSELAEKVGGFTLGFDSFKESLHLFDVVLCSTAGTDPILPYETVRKAIAKRPARPLFLIDVSMPRDVDQSVSNLESVYLYNLDDVSSIANENLKSRQAEVAKCREALEQKAGQIWNQLLFPSKPPA